MAHSLIPPIADFNAVAHHSPETAEKAWTAVNKGWQPGKEGKGMVVDGKLYHWNTENDDGFPHHHEVADVMNTAGVPVLGAGGRALADGVDLIYYIDPDGSFDSSQVNNHIVNHDPRLKFNDAGWKFGSKLADDGGGGDPGIPVGGDPAPVDPGPTPATVIYGYPYLGAWGHAMGHWQSRHRHHKSHKKKKSGFWTDQRRNEFPEDFEDEAPDHNDMPKEYNREEIMEFLKRGWTEGTHGKALIDESGRRYEWSPDKFGNPHHHEVELAIPCTSVDEILISPNGRQDSWRQMQEQEELNADARHQGLGTQWHFGSMEPSLDILNWDEGNEGKGILDGDGHLHTWNADDYETHHDYLAEHPKVNHEDAHYLYITPHGKVSTSWGTLTPEHEELIREADPRLYVDLDQGNGVPWSFGASVV